jgi:hypothetical protein
MPQSRMACINVRYGSEADVGLVSCHFCFVPIADTQAFRTYIFAEVRRGPNGDPHYGSRHRVFRWLVQAGTGEHKHAEKQGHQ